MKTYIIENIGTKPKWQLSIGNKAPWDNPIQIPIPGLIARILIKWGLG